jgi:predicted NUDIX family NTP pyrophosphohydrolase
VLLVHPGGPLWARRDDGAWTIPKGLVEPDESPEDAALRELREETGWSVSGALQPLGMVRQKAGKIVHGFAAPLDVDPATLVSNTFQLEWPPKSGRMQDFPEVDRAAWFTLPAARVKVLEAQAPFLDRVADLLRDRSP